MKINQVSLIVSKFKQIFKFTEFNENNLNFNKDNLHKILHLFNYVICYRKLILKFAEIFLKKLEFLIKESNAINFDNFFILENQMTYFRTLLTDSLTTHTKAQTNSSIDLENFID